MTKDLLEVKRGFESKKCVIKESSNDQITMRFPVTLLDVLNEKRQSKGTMAEYIEQTMYSHSVTARSSIHPPQTCPPILKKILHLR
jgi:hypothetical protein